MDKLIQVEEADSWFRKKYRLKMIFGLWIFLLQLFHMVFCEILMTISNDYFIYYNIIYLLDIRKPNFRSKK